MENTSPYKRSTRRTKYEREIARDDAKRAEPWTLADYERLRKSVLACVRTHLPIDLPDGRTLSGVDGHLFWNLLGALDREPDERRGRPRQ